MTSTAAPGPDGSAGTPTTRVGLCFDLRNPPAWAVPGAELYDRALERAAWAEELGIDAVWATEHHFFEDGYLTNPLTFLAAVAARTTRVRLGTGITIAPLRRAIDIAEQAAIVDLISDGRLELGLGAGYRRPEFEAFGSDMASRMSDLDERARTIRELWDGGGLQPQPVQPHAPLWLGVHGPRGARMAGRVGAGLLRLDEGLMEPYVDGLRQGGHDPAAARLGGPAGLLISEDPEATWARVAPYLAYQWNSYAWYGAEGTDAPRGATPADGGAEPLRPETLRSAGPNMNSPRFDVVTPDEAVRRLQAWLGGLPVEHVYFWASIPGMPDDLAEEHVRLLATRVAPALRAAGSETPTAD